jgi:hypothetical protein
MIGTGRCRNLAGAARNSTCRSQVIRPREVKDLDPMIRSTGAVGFVPAPVASSRLINAVAASLAFGAASLCLISSLKVLAVKLAAMPIPMM